METTRRTKILYRGRLNDHPPGQPFIVIPPSLKDPQAHMQILNAASVKALREQRALTKLALLAIQTSQQLPQPYDPFNL